MDDIRKRLEKLSPEKRALLLKKLQARQKSTGDQFEIPPRKDPARYPMSFAQRGFWYLEQMQPGTGLNNIPAIIRMKGRLDVQALERAIQTILDRHQVLRTRYRVEAGEPVQSVLDDYTFRLSVIDLRTEPETQRQQRAESIARQQALKPFDLSTGPMFRCSLIQLADDDFLMVLVMHHIAADAWSIDIFIHELGQLYDAYRQQKTPQIADLPIQYFDYAEWQRERLQGDRLNELIDYWREKLKDAPSLLDFPTDKPRPYVRTFRGLHIPFQLTPELSRTIDEWCRREKVTPFAFFLTAFYVLLYRYSRQEDICVGTAVANRDQKEVQALIGLFINTVVLRSHIDGQMTFRELLYRVKDTVLDAFAHKDLPFDMLVDALKPQRQLSHNPFYQVLFDFRNRLEKIQAAGLELDLLEIESGTVKFDMVLSIENTPQGYRGAWAYNTDLFYRETIDGLIRSFQTLLRDVVRDVDRPISRLNLIPPAEVDRLVDQWNPAPWNFPGKGEKCMHHYIEEQAREHPDKVALVYYSRLGDQVIHQEMTYRELNERANRLAHHLQQKGVQTEDVVALFMDRSLDMLVAILGVLKAGAAYLPIDPVNPKNRVDFMLNDSGVRLVLTQEKLKHRLADHPCCQLLVIDAEWETIARQPGTNPDVPLTPENLAYLIYTSGSTGIPKAVMVPHRGLVSHSWNMKRLYDLKNGCRVLQYFNLSFDAAAEEIFPTLLAGATLVLPRAALELTYRDLLEICESQRINILHLTKAVWLGLLDYMEENQLKFSPHLRMMFVGGEAPTVNGIQKTHRLSSGKLVFVNMYGPTEATIAASNHVIDLMDDMEFPTGVIPIGRPMDNVRLYVLDEHLQPVPQGAFGELYIGGIGVSRGYLNRPDLTAAYFLPDPFSSKPGARMYRTGDLVRLSPEGELVFIGRVDFQVKIRGFRVELGEIETVLNQHPDVQQGVVVARDDRLGSKFLAAYIVPKEHQEISISALRSYLSEKLPDYMVPTTFTVLEEIPLTPTGKIDRNRLPDPELDRSQVETTYVAPKSPLEKYLYRLWKDILGIDRIGIHDNFFELGGNSIQAATLVNRLQDELGEYVYIVAIYDAPTIAQMRDYLIREYPDSVRRLTGEAVEVSEEAERPVDASMVDFLRGIIRVPEPVDEAEWAKMPKNPPAVFILSAPRSGSTLTRAMLGGNPRLFAPPELQLLNFTTLQERRQVLSGRDEFWRDGTIRALMAMKDCDVDEARRIMEAYEQEDLTVKEFYRLMQEWIDDRLFVDKTPNYALSLDILNRAELYFENNKYIHLIRHPYGMIPSFRKARLHVFYPPFFTTEHAFTARQLAELVWVISNRNILKFLENIPGERQFRLYYEDLVTRPREVMEQICEFLEIEFHPDMLDPQKDRKKRMTDALNELSKMLGDVRFHEHRGISANRAYKWKEELKEDYLSDLTWELVEHLGYEPRQEIQKFLKRKHFVITRQEGRNQYAPSFSQQRLWFLDQLEPESAFYNVPSAVRVQGTVDATLLEQAINRIVQRHETLRTRFETQDGKPVAVVEPDYTLKLEEVDLTQLSGERQEVEVQRIVEAEARRPFQLNRLPLIRIKLLRTGPESAIFLLNAHHIIFDGFSLEIFIRELTTIYQALQAGRDVALPPLPVQYSDYADWQRRWLEDPIVQKQLEYWKQKLADSPPLLELPTDRPRPAVQSYRGRRLFFQVPASVARAVKKLAQEKRTTPYVALMSAYYLMLHHFSGQDDLTVGTVVSGRNRREIEPLIGFFVNTLALRNQVQGEQTFLEFMQQVHQTVQEAVANQDIPFEKLVDSLNLERHLNYAPLFQVVFAYYQMQTRSIAIPGLTLTPMEVETGTARFDFAMSLVETTDGIHGTLEYSTDLFHTETVERMLNHYWWILEQVLENPHRKLRELELLRPEERQELEKSWQATRRDLGQEAVRGIHQLFEKQASDHPEALAAICVSPMTSSQPPETLTYDQLNRRANQLAHYLREKGVGADTLVGILMERSLDMLVALLGILKAGGAYVPIDPTYPEERIRFIIRDSGVSIVITHKDFHAKLSDLRQLKWVALDKQGTDIAAYPEANPDLPLDPDQLVYLIYTSGTTGVPKGVMVTHRSLVNHAMVMRRHYGLEHGDRVLQYITFSFDAAGEEIYPTLISGATLVLPPPAVDLTNADILHICREQQIHYLHLPVPVWHSWHDFLVEQDLQVPESVRKILVGGEAPSVDRVKQLVDRVTHPILFENVYGPTETTITVTGCELRIPEDVDALNGSVPIGTPIDNVRVYLLDRHLRPVPPGAFGELYVGGVSVARGYWKRPDITAERFLPDPFSPEPGARMYRTGDLCRLQNGQIVFVGRVDKQVKIRGFRIEPGEIEAVVRQHPGVRDALVEVHTDARGTRRLVCYWIRSAEAGELSSTELRQFLQNKLPDYMVPAFFMELEAFPLTAHGKIDRRALPEPRLDRSQLGEEYLAPRNEIEKTLVDIWKEVLGVEQIGVRDNFFELGGDSISSIRVISLANQAGLKLQPRHIFMAPTIEGLARYAGQAQAIHAEQGPVTGTVPLTPIQHKFFQKRFANPHHWNQSVLLEIPADIASETIEQVVAALMEHHDALRTRYRKINGDWEQYIAEMEEPLPFTVVDLSDIPPEEQSQRIEETAATVQGQLHLEKGPLVRFVHFVLGNDQPNRLLIVIHHLVVDGVSWRILMEDFTMAYQQLKAGKPIQLPPKTTSFKYWAERLQQKASSPEIQEELTYWGRLAELQLPPFPEDHPEGENLERTADRVHFTLNKEATQALLTRVPRIFNTQIDELLLTALALAYQRFTGRRKLLVAVEGHGRELLFDDVDISRTIGWFTNEYPVFLDLGKSVHLKDAIVTIKEQVRAIPGKGMGYGLLRYLASDPAVQQKMAAIPEPVIGFNYLGQFNTGEEKVAFGIAPENPGPERAPENERMQLLTISASVQDGEMRFYFSYSTARHRRESIQEFASHFEQVLREIIQQEKQTAEKIYTPSDFADVKMDQEEFEQFMSELEEGWEDE
ncbi:MAG: amino acid adenylation domain-containing protein [Calditrichaeota bacterium]|nr:amino acid adenylation domain-containing protein [Calditrichota bacterium]